MPISIKRDRSKPTAGLRNAVRAVVFFLGLCVIITILSRIFERKTSAQMYDVFFETKEDVDVLFLGTSHMSNAVLPLQLMQEQGFSSFNLAGHGNQLATTYWVLVNALDYADPQVVVLDLSYLGENQKTSLVSVNQTHTALDAIPFSMNKVRMVDDLFDTTQEKAEFLADFLIYHDRWEELSAEDFESRTITYRGAAPGFAVAEPIVTEKIPREDCCEPDTVGVEYLNRIMTLCRERGIEVVWTYLPFPADEEKQREANLGYVLAEEYGVPYLNFLDLDVVDLEVDCLDASSHLNLSGAVKCTRYLGEFLAENFNLPDRRGEAEYACWGEELTAYTQAITGLLLVDQTDPYKSLMLLVDPNIHAGVTVCGEQSAIEDPKLRKLLDQASAYQTVEYDTEGSDYLLRIDVRDSDGNSYGEVVYNK